jgi:FKBP-type peptidyl-prolyl cis-trans isomerase FklB
MKKISVVLGASLLLLFSCVNDKSSVTELDKLTFTPEVDSMSYAIGIVYSNYIFNNIGVQKLNFTEFEDASNTFLNEGSLRIHQDSGGIVIDEFVKQFEDTLVNPVNANYDNLDDISYSLGLDIAKTITTRFNLAFNPLELTKAFRVIFEGEESKMSFEEANICFEAFMIKQQKEQEKKSQSLLMEKLVENRKSMKNTVNGKVTLNSGLQIEILSEGNGVSPTLQDQVTVHYTGKLVDGTIFDSSVDRGEPVVFPISGVIPGWTEALQLMQVGSKWNLVIPSDLAYGEVGIPQAGISPNSTLYFEVELLKIN